MKKESTIRLLEKHRYTNLVEAGPDVFRAERRHGMSLSARRDGFTGSIRDHRVPFQVYQNSWRREILFQAVRAASAPCWRPLPGLRAYFTE